MIELMNDKKEGKKNVRGLKNNKKNSILDFT